MRCRRSRRDRSGWWICRKRWSQTGRWCWSLDCTRMAQRYWRCWSSAQVRQHCNNRKRPSSSSSFPSFSPVILYHFVPILHCPSIPPPFHVTIFTFPSSSSPFLLLVLILVVSSRSSNLITANYLYDFCFNYFVIARLF